jgi:hypothetical protein
MQSNKRHNISNLQAIPFLFFFIPTFSQYSYTITLSQKRLPNVRISYTICDNQFQYIPFTAHKKVLLSEGAHPSLGHHLYPTQGRIEERNISRAKKRPHKRERHGVTKAERHGEKYIYTVTGAHRSTAAPPPFGVTLPARLPSVVHPARQRWGRGGANCLTYTNKVRVRQRHTRFNIRCIIFKNRLNC